MSTNIEIEAKILVNEHEFNLLKSLLNINESFKVIQTNYYIDDPIGSLRKFGFALRIRELNKTFTLTLKSPMAEGTLEKNQTLTEQAYTTYQKGKVFPLGLIKDFL